MRKSATGMIADAKKRMNEGARSRAGKAAVEGLERRVLLAGANLPGDWSTFGNGPARTGYFPGILGDDMFVQAWNTDLDSQLNSVSVGGGRVYVTNRASGRLVALDPNTGGQIWRSSAVFHTLSGPTYYGGRVYVAQSFSDAGVWAFDANTGIVAWSTGFLAQHGSYYGPAITNDGIFVEAGYLGGLQAIGLDGSKLWSADIRNSERSASSFLDGSVYVEVPEGIAKFSANGELQWTNSAVGGDGTIALAETRGYVAGLTGLAGVNLRDGTTLWRVTGDFRYAPAIAGGVVYAKSGNVVRSFDEATGRELMSYVADATLTSPQPIVTDDSLMISGANATYVFSLRTGALRQKLPVGGELSLAQGILYVAGAQGRLYAYRATQFTPQPLRIGGTEAADMIRVEMDLADIRVTNNGSISLISAERVSLIVIDGYGGNDTLFGAGKGLPKMIISGGSGNDTLQGADNDDTLLGNGGDDSLKGMEGADLLGGASGRDTLIGAIGDDTLNGGADRDWLQGEYGNDQLIAWDGATGDILMSGPERDSVVMDMGEAADTDDITVRVDLDSHAQFSGTGADDVIGVTISGANIVFELNGIFVSCPSAGLDGIRIDALAGNDRVTLGAGVMGAAVYGGDGRDTIVGGVGNDTLFGELGADSITGGNGDDSLEGGIGNDYLNCGRGNDTASGGDGNDTIFGGGGLDQLAGDVGNDQLQANDGGAGDMVAGGEGTDVLISDAGEVGSEMELVLNVSTDQKLLISGGNGNDVIAAVAAGGNVMVTVNGIAGTYPFAGLAGIQVDALAGQDHVTIGAGLVGIVVNGGDGDDTISGGDGADLLNGEGGDDSISGGVGNDAISGGSGNDHLFGQGGIDVLRAAGGADTLEGGGGNDEVYGGADNDSVLGGLGDDRGYLGTGNDYACGDDGADSLYGEAGNDILRGSTGKDLLDGGSEDDSLNGGMDDDRLYGQAGVDSLWGGMGRDFVSGGDGGDWIYVRDGAADTVQGNQGTDSAEMDELLEVRGGVETVLG